MYINSEYRCGDRNLILEMKSLVEYGKFTNHYLIKNPEVVFRITQVVVRNGRENESIDIYFGKVVKYQSKESKSNYVFCFQIDVLVVKKDWRKICRGKTTTL